MKKKIAFVIIRYGADVNGGAELHCRMLAERLVSYYDVEVLTSTIRIFGTRSGTTLPASKRRTESPSAAFPHNP